MTSYPCYVCGSREHDTFIGGRNRIETCSVCDAELSHARLNDIKWWQLRRRFYDFRESQATDRFLKRMIDA